MKITDYVGYIGVSDNDIDLFESQYSVPNGITYNSYIIQDKKSAIIDTVDIKFFDEWISNIKNILGDNTPDYLIIQHMEPDHSANIDNFIKLYPKTKIVASLQAFNMMKNFFNTDYPENKIVICDKDTLCLGQHTLTFLTAPMVHWPEVIVTYDNFDQILFSADAFGSFGNPEKISLDKIWPDEARRYYIGIVGKYGAQVQSLLKKVSNLNIKKICSAHGSLLTENLSYYINLYNTWSSYLPENEGIMIAYTSIYGNTKKAVDILSDKLRSKNISDISIFDLARCDMSEAISSAFKYKKIILATQTYNSDIFPPMKTFINGLIDRNFQNHTVGIIENGSWAPMAAKIIQGYLEKNKNINILNNIIHIKSSLNQENINQLDLLTDEISK